MKRIVISGEIQSGFRTVCNLGLKEWTVEAGILKFPELFDRQHQEAARFRLEQAI